jgi:hypothetical protein
MTMNSQNTGTTPQPGAGRTEKLFTVTEANQSLVLVRKIVADIVGHYERLLTLRDKRHDLAARTQPEGLDQLTRSIETVTDELNVLHGELSEIGVVLKDWADGLVDFPAEHEGRKVWLCWRLGEPAVAHWHERNAGYSGRRPIGSDFK